FLTSQPASSPMPQSPSKGGAALPLPRAGSSMGRQEELAGVKEGEVLANKYRVDRVLGVGGMGVVVAAHHLQLDDRVAIKFLLPETLHNEEAVARFARAARAG